MKYDYYIYIYLDPRKPGKYKYGKYEFEYEPFYIGKGKNERCKKVNNRTDYFKNKINKIKESNLEPLVIKIEETLSEEESFILESELIELIGRRDLNKGPLINFTYGGEGKSGYVFSEKILKKMRKKFSEIQEEFNKRNYKLLTIEEEYKNCYTKLNCTCPRGHNIQIPWNHFKDGQNCCECTNEDKRKNFSDIEDEFKNRNYKLITKKEDYKNNHTKLKFICDNGHKHSIRWDHFKNGSGCPICIKESMKGENNPSSKLTTDNIIIIKKLLITEKLTNKEIGIIFGVSRKTILDIKNGKTWSHIKLGEITI